MRNRFTYLRPRRMSRFAETRYTLPRFDEGRTMANAALWTRDTESAFLQWKSRHWKGAKYRLENEIAGIAFDVIREYGVGRRKDIVAEFEARLFEVDILFNPYAIAILEQVLVFAKKAMEGRV